MLDNPNMYSIQRKLFHNSSTYIFELYYDDTGADDIESDSLINLLYSPFVNTIREVKLRSNKYFLLLLKTSIVTLSKEQYI